MYRIVECKYTRNGSLAMFNLYYENEFKGTYYGTGLNDILEKHKYYEQYFEKVGVGIWKKKQEIKKEEKTKQTQNLELF